MTFKCSVESACTHKPCGLSFQYEKLGFKLTSQFWVNINCWLEKVAELVLDGDTLGSYVVVTVKFVLESPGVL